MSAAKPALQEELITVSPEELSRRQVAANLPLAGPRRIVDPAVRSFPTTSRKEAAFQARVPAITGEATFRGLMAIDGIITGQLGTAGSLTTVKQRAKSHGVPELDGEISFKDMLRVNGHVAGRI